MDAKKFGEKLYNLRKRDNLTQVQLANKLNVSNKLVSKWENGLSIPNTEMVADICNVFHVEINDLLEINSIAPRKKSRKIILNAKNKKILKISLISFLCLFLFFVSYFHFVPMIFKNYHLNNLSTFADNNFSNGYINFDMQLEVDGKRTRQTHKGYIDDEKLIYEIQENERPDAIILNNVLIDFDRASKIPIDTSGIKNARELFSYSVKRIDDAGIGFTENNLNVYKVRKIGSTYKVFFYLNFTSNGIKFNKGVFNCHIEDNRINKIDYSIDVSVKDKSYRAKGFFNFYDFKPNITINQESIKCQWKVDDIKNISTLSNEELGGSITTKTRDENHNNFIGYKDFLIYYTEENSDYIINFLDLSKDTTKSVKFPYNIHNLSLNFVYDNKLYIIAKSKENYEKHIYTYDLILEKFEILENTLTHAATIKLFDKVYIIDYDNTYTIKYSTSLDGKYKFNGQIFYQNKDTILSHDRTKNKVLEYNKNTLVKEYFDIFDGPVALIRLNEDYVLTINEYRNGTIRTNDLQNYYSYLYVNYQDLKLYAVKDDKIYTSYGIFYNDLYKKPIFYDYVDYVILLDNYDVYFDYNNMYIVNKST